MDHLGHNNYWDGNNIAEAVNKVLLESLGIKFEIFYSELSSLCALAHGIALVLHFLTSLIHSVCCK